jgi:tetratricopeptide (TPR) repeat protein
VCRAETDTKRAIRILHQAVALDPMLAPAHYWIGLLEAGLFHKPQAIVAFERAVALDPNNLDYKKDLGRAHNISTSQIAFERAASGTRFGLRVAKLTGAGFALLLVITIVMHLADPATRLATIFTLVVGSGFIVLFIDTVKVMWANVTGRG